MAGELKVKSGGSWRTITDPEVKVSGTWQPIVSIEVKVGGAWQEVFSGAAAPVVDANINGFHTYSDDGDAYAHIVFKNTGAELITKSFQARPSTPTVSRGNWLTSGDASAVWIQRVIDTGTLDTDAGSARLNLGTDREFGVHAPNENNHYMTITFNFYDAASGGSLLDTVSYFIRTTSYGE